MSVIVSPFGFLEMQVEGVSRQALELCQANLGQSPEALDAIDVNVALGELVPGMVDAEVAVTEVDQAIVASPAVGVDDGAGVHPASDDALQGWLGAVGNDLSVDLALALEDAEHGGLAVGAAAAPALDPARAEETLVDLNHSEQGALCLAIEQNPFSQAAVEAIHGVAVQAAQGGCLKGGQVGRKIAHQLAELGLRNPRTLCILVFH